jgi:hypothetical protein
MSETTRSNGRRDLEKAAAGKVVGCPSSDYWKNESKDFLVCNLLLFMKEAEGRAVIIKPFNNFHSLFDATHEVDSKLQVIANNEIHLMRPAKQNYEPDHTNKQQPPHSPTVSTIVSAPCNNDDSVLRLHELNIFKHKAQQKSPVFCSAETSRVCIRYAYSSQLHS